MTWDGGPAFPNTSEQSADGTFARPGMSLRDYFAAMSLHGLLAEVSKPGEATAEVVAKGAYMLADAMLAERAK